MTKFGLLCTAALLVGASSAHALNLGMPGFAGYSVLSNPCPLCDSLVDFTVYQNIDGDWTDDPYFANVSQNGMADSDGQWGTSIDSSAGYVYMYQPVNLDNNNPPDNPLGVKGCGEAGAIGAPPAVINAISNALGVKHIDMPATPENVWRAAQQATAASA